MNKTPNKFAAVSLSIIGIIVFYLLIFASSFVLLYLISAVRNVFLLKTLLDIILALGDNSLSWVVFIVTTGLSMFFSLKMLEKILDNSTTYDLSQKYFGRILMALNILFAVLNIFGSGGSWFQNLILCFIGFTLQKS